MDDAAKLANALVAQEIAEEVLHFLYRSGVARREAS